MTYQPHKVAADEANDVRLDSGMTAGIVTDVNYSSHSVTYREMTETGTPEYEGTPDSAVVPVGSRGDIVLPSVNDTVIIALLQNGLPVVLATYYTDTEQIRDDVDEERHIGAESSAGLFLHGPFGVVPKTDADPSDAADGAIWYNTTADEYRGVENGSTVRFDTTVI